MDQNAAEDFVQLAVAMSQSDLALVKCALEEAKARFFVSTDCNGTLGPHPDFFPVFVAVRHARKASRALRRFGLERLLAKS